MVRLAAGIDCILTDAMFSLKLVHSQVLLFKSTSPEKHTLDRSYGRTGGERGLTAGQKAIILEFLQEHYEYRMQQVIESLCEAEPDMSIHDGLELQVKTFIDNIKKRYQEENRSVKLSALNQRSFAEKL